MGDLDGPEDGMSVRTRRPRRKRRGTRLETSERTPRRLPTPPPHRHSKPGKRATIRVIRDETIEETRTRAGRAAATEDPILPLGLLEKRQIDQRHRLERNPPLRRPEHNRKRPRDIVRAIPVLNARNTQERMLEDTHLVSKSRQMIEPRRWQPHSSNSVSSAPDPCCGTVHRMREIRPGLWHWTATHPLIGITVSGYRLAAERVLLDPVLPEEGAGVLGDPPPTDVLLTNRHHWRGCTELIAAFGVTVHAPRSGLHEFGLDRPVTPYDPGDELPGGAVVHEVGHLCPDEMALWFPAYRALAIADGVIRHPPDGPLAFVPDQPDRR